MKTRAALGLFLLSTTLAAAEPPSPAPERLVGFGYVFPSAANVAGAHGAYFRTRMVLTNPHSTSIALFAVLNTQTGEGGKKVLTLGPGETKVYENFLQDAFSYTGGGGVALQELSETRPFVANAEVWAENANGRFSTPLVGMWTADRVVNLASHETGRSISAGVRVDASNRANLGCMNLQSVPAKVRADVFNENSPESGKPAAEILLTLPAFGWAQASVPVSGEKIRVLFWQLTEGAATHGNYCYAVNVNNLSNDGTSLPAVRVDNLR